MIDIFNFDLPQELIAQAPAQPRDHARLLVYDRNTKHIRDVFFYDLPKYLPAHTSLVLNKAKVDKCRLRFGSMEIFILDTHNPTTITCMVRPGKKFKLGKTIALNENLTAKTIAIDEEGLRTIELAVPLDDPVYDQYKLTPLPPYIEQNELLSEEYQTVYAKDPGSKASPTAGLHFTKELLTSVKQHHPVIEITLNVGLGTFALLKESSIESGTLHEESYEVNELAAKQLSEAQSITAVGTTSLRTLESVARDGNVAASKGATNIFIRPGHTFQVVDHLITNFHLPGTSLLLLVEAFIGSRDELARIYRHSIEKQYRFYSFGDAMLIV